MSYINNYKASNSFIAYPKAYYLLPSLDYSPH